MEKSYPAPTGYSKKEMEGIFSKTKTGLVNQIASWMENRSVINSY